MVAQKQNMFQFYLDPVQKTWVLEEIDKIYQIHNSNVQELECLYAAQKELGKFHNGVGNEVKAETYSKKSLKTMERIKELREINDRRVNDKI